MGSKDALKPRLAPMGAAVEKRMVPEGDEMDTSETVIGGREGAPVEGVMDSDAPSHTQGKSCRAGDFH